MPSGIMETPERRRLIATRPNPESRLDYVVTLSGRTAGADDRPAAAVLVRYVPDRLLMDREAFAAYLSALPRHVPGHLERLAVTVIEDINDQIVARWLHVSTVAETADEATGEHRVDIEDRQPRWDNARMLARLERF